jgi:hypothetical protein
MSVITVKALSASQWLMQTWQPYTQIADQVNWPEDRLNWPITSQAPVHLAPYTVDVRVQFIF